tara:strand:+ start:82 stop:1014 length:933 start_codon:yes stop_codon:yes gene_type:complete
MRKLRTLDLFAGIGGFSLGLHRTGGFETVAFVERDDYASKVLAKNFKGVPIYDDVRTFDADGLGRIDCVTGGYPCQPFSVAGKRLGKEDDRHLWPEMLRIVVATRPRWVIAENVAGHINMGLDQVLSDLEGEGYTSQPIVIPACAVDAPHKRDRVWILAHTDSPHGFDVCGQKSQQRKPQQQRVGNGSQSQDVSNPDSLRGERRRESGICRTGNGQDETTQRGDTFSEASGRCENVAHTDSPFSEGNERAKRSEQERANNSQLSRWATEPDICRVAHGIPRRVDRLRCLGNAIVPQIATQIGNAILKAEK